MEENTLEEWSSAFFNIRTFLSWRTGERMARVWRALCCDGDMPFGPPLKEEEYTSFSMKLKTSKFDVSCGEGCGSQSQAVTSVLLPKGVASVVPQTTTPFGDLVGAGGLPLLLLTTATLSAGRHEPLLETVRSRRLGFWHTAEVSS